MTEEIHESHYFNKGECTKSIILVASRIAKAEKLFTISEELIFPIRMEVASSRPDHLPTLPAAKTSELSLLV